MIARAHHTFILLLAVLLAVFWPARAGAHFGTAGADRLTLTTALQLKEKGFTRKTASWLEARLTLENQGDGAGPATVFLDASGNVTALIDGNQNVQARYEYGPFGRLVGMWGALGPVNEMQFSSMPASRLSGIIGYWGRGYDPTFQRWIQRDPIGERGGINLYGFVGNNPVNFADPFGLQGFGNPISGPTGPVGPSSVYSPGLPYFPNGFMYQPSPTPQFPVPTYPPPHAEMSWDPYTGSWYTSGGLNRDDDLFALFLPLFKGPFKLSVCAAKTAKEGIYEFTAASGKTYVGQSGDIAARLEQHLATGKLLPDDLSTVSTTEVLGGKTAREVAEQLRINELGGVQNLENIRNPIGPGRQYLLLSQPQ